MPGGPSAASPSCPLHGNGVVRRFYLHPLGHVTELNTMCFESPWSPSLLGKKGVVGNHHQIPFVIKMDAIYFFWHSNYIDVCRQLFVLTWSILSAAVSPSTFDTVSPQGWQALLEGHGQEPRLGLSWLPWNAGRGRLMFPGGPKVGKRLGRCFPLSFHTPHFLPSLPHSQTPTLLPSILCVNENSGPGR